MNDSGQNRRDFLRSATLTALGLGVTGEILSAEEQARQTKPAPKPPPKQAPAKPAAPKPAQKPAQKPPARVEEQLKGPTVNLAVIGLGPRGREILASLARIGPVANIVSICDNFKDPFLIKRATDIAPKAQVQEEYRRILDDSSVHAVFIATPTHRHKQIVLDALAAGKHVYCEAPLAHTVEDAREIARAGKAASTVFQSGLQVRCNAQAIHVRNFVQTNALGTVTQARAQWHNKNSWRVAHRDRNREAELNWRLDAAISPGLLGEKGIHQIDTATWFLKRPPKSVTGYGGVLLWTEDDREVPDTAQCVLEYPGGVRMLYDATLTNSFDGEYELFMGSDSAILLRDQLAWMFKEADAGPLGWEVFARKDQLMMFDASVGKGPVYGTGIALVADATKQLALGNEPGKVGMDVTKTALYQACTRFLMSCQKGQRVFAKDPTDQFRNPPLVPGAEEGFEATVVALKCNEAVKTGKKIDFQKEWFTL